MAVAPLGPGEAQGCPRTVPFVPIDTGQNTSTLQGSRESHPTASIQSPRSHLNLPSSNPKSPLAPGKLGSRGRGVTEATGCDPPSTVACVRLLSSRGCVKLKTHAHRPLPTHREGLGKEWHLLILAAHEMGKRKVRTCQRVKGGPNPPGGRLVRCQGLGTPPGLGTLPFWTLGRPSFLFHGRRLMFAVEWSYQPASCQAVWGEQWPRLCSPRPWSPLA